MSYTFEILGVTPVIHFFNHQQSVSQKSTTPGVEYLGSFTCTLDAVLDVMEPVTLKNGWERDQAVNTVIQFWVNNADRIHYWKLRLRDAGTQSLMVSRLGTARSLRNEFERLFTQKSVK
jgi:hypothetical protein